MSQRDFWTAVLLTVIMVASGMMLAHVHSRGDQTSAPDRGAASASDTGAGE